MDAEPRLMDTLVQRWRGMTPADRSGILHRLSDDQRATFEQVLDASDRERRELAARAQRFRAYSPWLAALLEGCEKDAPSVAAVKPAVRAALLAAHEAIRANGEPPETQASLAAVVQSFVASLRQRL